MGAELVGVLPVQARAVLPSRILCALSGWGIKCTELLRFARRCWCQDVMRNPHRINRQHTRRSRRLQTHVLCERLQVLTMDFMIQLPSPTRFWLRAIPTLAKSNHLFLLATVYPLRMDYDYRKQWKKTTYELLLFQFFSIERQARDKAAVSGSGSILASWRSSRRCVAPARATATSSCGWRTSRRRK